MAYTINKTSGAVLATVSDGTIDAGTTDITLVGKNYAGYGELLNENFVKILENFANSSAPAAPMAGQLWWDTAGNLLKVYTGTAFKTVSSSTSSASQPSGSVVGDLWWDSANAQLKVYNGTGYTLIGPAFTAGSGQSGSIVETIIDSLDQAHFAVKLYVSDVPVAIVSKDPVYTPKIAIPGYTTIKPGINLVGSSLISGSIFNGDTAGANTLGGYTASQFLRKDTNETTTGSLTVYNNTGVKVGANAEFGVSVSGSDAIVSNLASNGDILVSVAIGGVASQVLRVDGATGIVQPTLNNTYDLGTSGFKFKTVYAGTFNGNATTANYADLAERFEADSALQPGTVVELGGVKEITKVAEELSEAVFGVVSTAPAHLMNANAGTDETHPAIAMSGRVPVQVVGKVRKGDRLVAAGNGMARAASRSEITAFNVIGRALNNKNTDGVGLVEAIVKLNS